MTPPAKVPEAGPWRPSVSAAYTSALRAYLRQRGLNLGVPLPCPSDQPLTQIDGLVFVDRLSWAQRELGDATLPLDFGQHAGGAAFGLLGLAAATACTLREAIFHLQRLEHLTSTLGELHVQRRGRRVFLVWKAAHASTPASVADAVISGWVSFGRHILSHQVEHLEVRVAHGPQGVGQSAYEQSLACSVVFNADQPSVSFDEELLDARPRLADVRFNAALDRWARHRSTGASTTCWRQHTMSWLTRQGLGSCPDEAAASLALGVDRRTLQRRLAAEGTSYRRLLDSARADFALNRVLHGDVPLSELVGEIGFDEQSSLCRAFRRWTGYAPLEVKRRLGSLYTELR